MATVIVQSDQGLRQKITAGKHSIVADEPIEAGGSDEGPDPYSLLLAALGACTSMTLHLYAKNKGWNLKSVRVTLKHAKIYASDCTECETKEGKLDRISREIEIDGDLSDDQRLRLKEIAKMCPVHRTLTSEINIVDA